MPNGEPPTRPNKGKIVIVDITVRMPVAVPKSYDADAVDFWLNESSHCIGNELKQLAESEFRANERSCCDTCNRTTAEVHNMTPTVEEINEVRLGRGCGEDFKDIYFPDDEACFNCHKWHHTETGELDKDVVNACAGRKVF